MKNFMIPALVSTIFAFSGAATAGDMMKKGTEADAKTPGFSQLDADSDGYVTQSEMRDNEELTNRWEQLDSNADQRLDPAEFSAFENAQPEIGTDPGMGTKGGSDTAPGTGTSPGMGTGSGTGSDRYQEGTDTVR